MLWNVHKLVKFINCNLMIANLILSGYSIYIIAYIHYCSYILLLIAIMYAYINIRW